MSTRPWRSATKLGLTIQPSMYITEFGTSELIIASIELVFAHMFILHRYPTHLFCYTLQQSHLNSSLCRWHWSVLLHLLLVQWLWWWVWNTQYKVELCQGFLHHRRFRRRYRFVCVMRRIWQAKALDYFIFGAGLHHAVPGLDIFVFLK